MNGGEHEGLLSGFAIADRCTEWFYCCARMSARVHLCGTMQTKYDRTPLHSSDVLNAFEYCPIEPPLRFLMIERTRNSPDRPVTPKRMCASTNRPGCPVTPQLPYSRAYCLSTSAKQQVQHRSRINAPSAGSRFGRGQVPKQLGILADLLPRVSPLEFWPGYRQRTRPTHAAPRYAMLDGLVGHQGNLTLLKLPP